jgi:UDP-GlcNAc:undecaprenyl-phosphate GlcNAc-1-phosphate transferase
VTGALTAFALSLAVGFGARAFGTRIGAVDRPGELKPHTAPTPYLGGAAVAAGLAAGLAVGSRGLPWGAVAALAGAFALGLLDDAREVPPPARLAAQLSLGVVLAAGGPGVEPLPTEALRIGATAVVFAAGLNAVNVVDGMDGLAAGAAAISAGGLALIADRAGQDPVALIAVALAGASLGFLAHNLPPARLFLGDNGSFLLGAGLVTVALGVGRTWPRLLGALTCFGLFGLDLLLAIVRRLRGGARLTRGDRGHVYDRLLARGLDRPRTLAACWAIHVGLVLAGARTSSFGTAAAAAATALSWAVAVGLGWLIVRER